MALSTEELVLQMEILTSRTSSNSNMQYKDNATLNKGLNPSYFYGNSTKIVNAINNLAETNSINSSTVSKIANKFNSLLLDVEASSENQEIWDKFQELSGKPTIIESIVDILEGNHSKELLNLKNEDLGKFLSVVQDENGKLTTKAIDVVIDSQCIEYTNDSNPQITNTSEALDYIFDNLNTNLSISWDDITHKPIIPNRISLTSEHLILTDEKGEKSSSVDIVSDNDIEEIISDLK